MERLGKCDKTDCTFCKFNKRQAAQKQQKQIKPKESAMNLVDRKKSKSKNAATEKETLTSRYFNDEDRLGHLKAATELASSAAKTDNNNGDCDSDADSNSDSSEHAITRPSRCKLGKLPAFIPLNAVP